VAAAAIALFVVVGVVAGVLSGSATRMTGDLVLQAKNFEFSKPVLTARAGRVAVFVDNQDVSSHDFTIKGVVQKSLPGQKAGRAVFDVQPGSYRFYCSLHPDMEGTLRVS
jgi:plastocyanin